MGSYDNVYACYGPSAPATPFNPGYGGFQCTELANRYLYNVNGDTVFGDSLVGGNFVSTVSAKYGISTASSGGSAMPVAGDIISMWGGSSGQSQSGDDTHVAVVTSVSGGTITTLNQNDASDSNGNNGVNTITVSGSSWSFNGGYYTSFDWLNLASSGGTPPSTGTDLVSDGSFQKGLGGWSVGSGTNFTTYTNGQISGTNAYEGSAYGATNTSVSGGSIYQDIPATISSGQSYCASMEAVTAGTGTGAGGVLALWLLGGGGNENSAYTFSNLPGNSDWTPGSTCITATTSHTSVEVQFYPDENGPTIAIDAVDLHSDLVSDGSFQKGLGGWSVGSGTNFTTYTNGQISGTNAYEGSAYGATNTSVSGGSIYQDIPATISSGQSYCASMEAVTAGTGTGAGGVLALWLLGGGGNENSAYTFSNLPGNSDWTPGSTCITATTSHTSVEVQFYPDENGPTIAIDAVDLHSDLVSDGSFQKGLGGWSVGSGTNFTTYTNGQISGTNAYEGSAYGATNTSVSGGSIYQDIPATISSGQSYCASMEAVTAGTGTGAGGVLALWLLGGGGNENSAYTFSNLPGNSDWTPGSTCITATTSHTSVEVQFYPDENGPTIAIDAVDTQAKGFGTGYPQLSLSTPSLPTAVVGSSYSQALSASGGATPYSWAVTAGSLPSGLSVSSSGVISGTPTASGSSTFTVEVSDASQEPMTATQSLTLTVVEPLAPSTTSPPSAAAGHVYSKSLTAVGGTAPYSWSISSGSLPPGLGLSPAGVVSGTPTTAGSHNFTVEVTDSSSPALTAAMTYTLKVTVGITPSSLAKATKGVSYTASFRATGGSAPYKWSISSGSPPAGVTLSSAGVISGTPTASGTHVFTVKVTDSSNPKLTATKSYSLKVTP